MSQSSRDKIIKTAHDLFYEVGFHAVGIDAILAKVGVTKTTFYKHFESKDDLVLETLRWHDRWWRDTFVEMLKKHGGDTPRGQLLAVPDVLQELFAGGDFMGCYFVNVAVQFPVSHDPAHEAAAEHKAAMGNIIREIAGYAGADNAEHVAQEMSLLLEGAYITQQVTKNPNTVEIARRVARGIVDRHLPAA